MKKCPKCGADNEDSAKFCSSCGADLREIQAAPAQAKTEQAPNTVSGMTLAALVLGIVSILIAFIGIFVASFICGLIGVICGIIGVCLSCREYMRKRRGGLTIASVICSIVGLVFAFIIFIIGIIILV